MSNRPADIPDDRRRRRGARRPSGATGYPPPEAAVEKDKVVVSRTLFSYLEPVLDTIASFGSALVVAGIVGLVSGITLVAFVSSMETYGYITIGIGAGLIGLVTLISFSSVFAAFIGRTGRYGVNTLILVAAFVGIIIVGNFVSFENTRRMDVTATNQFSLAGRTKQVLNDLEQEVEATAFYREDFRQQEDQDLIIRRTKVEDTLGEFEARSGKFSWRFVDPDLKPDIARKYFGPTPTTLVNESIVVEGTDSGFTHLVQPTNVDYPLLEQDLVTSLLVVSGQGQKRVYFLAGHGERDINRATAEGYGLVRNGLEGDNYQVQSLTWGLVDEEVSIPEDAALLVIAGPIVELPVEHARVLDLYLQGRDSDGSDRREAGRMAFLAEPDTPDSFREFLARWGVVVSPGYIRDVDRSVPGQPQTLRLEAINPLQFSGDLSGIPPAVLDALLQVTTPRGDSLGITFMPGAAPITLINDGLRDLVPLAATSGNSFLIEDLERTDPITGAGDQSDARGPFFPVASVQSIGPVGSPPPISRPQDNQFSQLVVFGDADFLSNSSFDRGSGADFFLNSANYLLGDFSLVSIRPKALTFREFNLDRNQRNFVRFSSWFFLPGLLGLMATLVWWLRR